MIRLAKTLLTIAAFGLVMSLAAPIARGDILLNAPSQSDDVFTYVIEIDPSGPDIHLEEGSTIALETDFGGFAVSDLAGPALAPGDVVLDRDGGTTVFRFANLVVFTEFARLQFTVTAPGASLSGSASYAITYTLEGEPTSPATGSFLVPVAQVPEGVAAPEPSTLALGLVGVAALAVTCRRRPK